MREGAEARQAAGRVVRAETLPRPACRPRLLAVRDAIDRRNARDLTVPPADSEAFAFLARRLRYGNDVAQLRADLARYTAWVQELNGQLLP